MLTKGKGEIQNRFAVNNVSCFSPGAARMEVELPRRAPVKTIGRVATACLPTEYLGHLLCMIGEKCLPGLRRRRAAPDSILRHSRFRKVEAEKTKFRLDPRRSPKRVFE